MWASEASPRFPVTEALKRGVKTPSSFPRGDILATTVLVLRALLAL
jgi:hypothetical protein